MSIEQILERHTAAVETLSDSITSLIAAVLSLSAAHPQAGTAAQTAQAPQASTASAAAAPTGRRSRAAATPGQGASPPNGAAAAGVQIKYDPDVREGVLKVAEVKGLAAAHALLKQFGATSGKELKAEQYPAVMAAIAQELATPSVA